MHYTIKNELALNQPDDCLVLPVWENAPLTSLGQTLNEISGGVIAHSREAGDFTGKLAQTRLFYLPISEKNGFSRLLLVGCGTHPKFTPTQFQRVFSCIASEITSLGIHTCCICLPESTQPTPDLSEWSLYQAVLTLEQALYRFDQFKSTQDPLPTLQTLALFIPEKLPNAQAILERALIVAKAVKQARDLGNLPSNICTPHHLAEQALSASQAIPGLKTTVLEEAELAQLGLQAFLAVARGSQEPPKFIVLEYQGTNAEQAPLALVGKGVTFDSGGISLKPGAGMDEMRYDMCGATTVLGVMSAAASLKLPLNLVGIMACTENMPSGKAYKPGDVVTTLSGQTIEILNTDAEGRVILSDALTYVERFKPDTVIDIATLTGAIIVALGDKASGLFTTDDKLAEALCAAGEKSWDRVWRLPLWDEYQEQIKSNIADMANIGSEGGKSITAACLLSRFTHAYRWAHLDIAGTAWISGKNKTATGRPIPLLMEFLFNRAR
ncbi:MAG: leucyl aminopeptidase [Gammaproteobacteria bacterium]|nr:leucyl aminopeptidase [Gammaproteobacteria bacterium]